MNPILYIFLLLFLLHKPACTQTQVRQNISKVNYADLKVGAQQCDKYFPMLKNKKTGVVANHTSLIGQMHLVDSLKNAGCNILRVFSPEHGFRGQAEAGASVENQRDALSDIPVISLYGAHKKPDAKDLRDIEIMIFDMQDVGVRFYTYLSTLCYVMEACAENDIPLLILDRPNPNGFYVDGPVLEAEHASFVGLHTVPVVHGMTLGEYAQMLNGEGWLKGGIHCNIKIIPVEGYTHKQTMSLPIKPSPNLPTFNSILLYPSLAFFEGTVVSVGRGTDSPFEIIGHPDFCEGNTSFTPQSIPGVSEHPPFKNIKCKGLSLSTFVQNPENLGRLNISWLLQFYEALAGKTNFFNPYFEKLSGTSNLREQIMQGRTETQIRKSWEKGLEVFKKIRAKYLLYPDFE